MPDIKYEITEHLAVLSTSSRGWSKELNLVSWNDRPAKYDLREWAPDHSRMGKGITLSDEEAKMLREALNEIVLKHHARRSFGRSVRFFRVACHYSAGEI